MASSSSKSSKSLVSAIVNLLHEPEVDLRIDGIESLVSRYAAGEYDDNLYDSTVAVPDQPVNPNGIDLVEPHLMRNNSKRRKQVHGLIHAEFNACALMLDLIARFSERENMPKDFVDDWMHVTGEEVAHFRSWRQRYKEMYNEDYGAVPCHDGLFDSARDTKDSLLARLAIVHGVHEARGLDVSVAFRHRLARGGDKRSLAILDNNVADETGHVARGIKWFKYLVERDLEGEQPVDVFHRLVRANFRGHLKEPFNHELREQAGFTREWYMPLTKD
jgi:uncharacterized ferritin-like protein (DUF455 family)